MGNKITTAAPTPAPIPQAAPAQKSGGGGLFGFVKDVFVGGGEAALGMVEGLGTMVCHPIKTVEGLAYGVTHPATLYHAFVDPFTAAIASGHPGEALGMGIVDVATFMIPGAGEAGAGADAADVASVAARAADAAAAAGKAADVAADAGKAADVAAAAGKTADVAMDAGKAADAAKAADVAAGASTTADAAAAGGDAARFAARMAEKPVMTRAAQAALSDANISSKVGSAALDAAHQAYWESRAAGESVDVAKAAAAAKAAQITGLAQDSVAVTKIVGGARLAGAATDTAEWIGRTDYVERPLVAGAKAIGGAADRGIAAVDRAGTYVAQSVKALPGEVSAAASKIGDITIKDIVTAPIRIPLAAARGVKNILGAALDATKAQVAAVGVDASNAVADASDAVGQAAKDAGQVAEDVGKTPLKDLPGAIGQGASKVGGILSAGLKAPFKLAGKAVRFAITHPKIVAGAALAGEIGVGALAMAQGAGSPSSISDAQVQQIAQQYGLLPTQQNVQAFLAEVQSYQGTAIGPDQGTPDQVKQLQTALASLGYAVNPSGKWDTATANAVVDFKKENGIAQSYKMADGSPAVNEYVDEKTANAMVAALKSGWHAGQSSTGTSSSTTGTSSSGSGTASSTPATGSSSSTGGSSSSTASTGSTTRAGSATAATTSTTASTTPAAPSTYSVQSGDTLSAISAKVLGNANRWPEIYDLNKGVIGSDPNLIRPGMVLQLPASSASATGSTSATGSVSATAPSSSTTTASNSPSAPQLSDQQVASLAKQYSLDPSRANVEAFATELSGLQSNGLGPDAGDAQGISNLQQALSQLGYSSVKATGKWDDATSNAVMDFKEKHGIHESYKLGNGQWAVNEYVDETTANAIAQALTAGHDK